MIERDLPGRRYRLETDDAELSDLRERLQKTRFPKSQAGAPWATGTPTDYMLGLRNYWVDHFDWPAWVARINQFEQRMVDVDGQAIHVIAEIGSGDNPLPLVLSHGWPGSFIEFINLIDRLAHPQRHGGRVEDAFTVVIPSLPGYGLSPAPAEPIGPAQIAALWASLMTEAFAFDRYVAYGSDWGSLVTALMARDHPERLRGVLLTSAGLQPTVTPDAPLTTEEEAWQTMLMARMQPESAYQQIQATKPQTLAFAQTDSPIGLAAWIVEKFHGWTIAGSDVDPPFSMDVLLANIMLYWLNGSVAPSWLYMFLYPLPGMAPGERVAVPAGFLLAPDDLFPPAPCSWLERVWDVAHYRVAGVGHFPGMDSPDLLTEELRNFFHAIPA